MNLSDLVPNFILIWIGTLVLAAFRSGPRASNLRLRAQSFVSRWISSASWLSMGPIVHQAYQRNLLSVPAAVLVIVLSYVVLAGANWLIETQYIDTGSRS